MFKSGLSQEQLKRLLDDFETMGKKLEDLASGSVRKNGNSWQACLRYTKPDSDAASGKKQIVLTHTLDARCTGRGSTSKPKATKMLGAWRLQVIEDAVSLRGFRADTSESFAAVARKYISNRENSGSIKHSSADCMVKHIICVEKYAFSSLPVGSITRPMIQEMVNDLAKRLSGITIRGIVTTIKSVFAATLGKGMENPCDGLILPLADHNQKRRTSTQGVIVLDSDGIARLNVLLDKLDAWEEAGYSRTAMAARLALNCGLRTEECCGLRWVDCDLDGDRPTISVKNVVSHTTVEGDNGEREWKTLEQAPKSKSSIRTLPISAELRDYLKGYREYVEDYLETLEGAPQLLGMRVLDDLETFEIRKPPSVTGTFHAFAKRHNLRDEYGRLISMHCLRHTFGSVIAKKHGLAVASRALGHSNVAMTAKFYQGATSNELYDAITETASIFNAKPDDGSRETDAKAS